MQDWEAIATIDGAGNSNEVLHYTHSDLIPTKMQADSKKILDISLIAASFIGLKSRY